MRIRLGFIGGGHMATSIIKGMIKSGVFDGATVSDTVEIQRNKLAALGCAVTSSNLTVVENSDFIVIAVKPNVVSSVLDEAACLSESKCFLSIAAGITTKFIRSRLPESAVVLRAMPNMNSEVGAGAAVLAKTEDAPRRFVEFAKALFCASGTVEELPESLFSAVTSVSGSSPAYFFLLADAMMRAAAEQGIDEATALRLVCQSMLGSALTLRESGLPPGKLAQAVATPGGTTEAALKALHENEWPEAVRKAMAACANRSEEISKALT